VGARRFRSSIRPATSLAAAWAWRKPAEGGDVVLAGLHLVIAQVGRADRLFRLAQVGGGGGVGQAHLLGAAGFHGAPGGEFVEAAGVLRGLGFGGAGLGQQGAGTGLSQGHLATGDGELGAGGIQLGLHGGHGGIGLLLAGGELGVLEAGEELAGLHAVAFPHLHLGDAPGELAGHGGVVALDAPVGLDQAFGQRRGAGEVLPGPGTDGQNGHGGEGNAEGLLSSGMA
jgi:hypothetical protein